MDRQLLIDEIDRQIDQTDGQSDRQIHMYIDGYVDRQTGTKRLIHR